MATAAVKKAVAARAAVGSAVELMRQELAELAAKREELVERRAAVEAAPVDRESAEGQVADLVAALAVKADLPAGWLAQGPRGYVDLLRELAPGFGPNAPPPPNPWPVLALVAPDLLTVALRQRLRDAYDKLPAPMTAEQRRGALAEVDQELAAVERQASELWWEALDSEIQLSVPDVSGEALAGLEPAST
jgi:hypothetical protein